MPPSKACHRAHYRKRSVPSVVTQDQPRPDNESQAKTFTGKITKANGKYVLQEASGGSSYQLDDQDNAKKYSGKSVLVTGTLDASTNTIRVQKIEASAQLPDGTKFDGVAGLRRILEERSDQFVYTMTEKLLTFALGRGADWYDAPAIRSAVRAAQKDDYRFATLVTSIVSSRPFQMRMSQSPDEAPQRSAQRSVKAKGSS